MFVQAFAHLEQLQHHVPDIMDSPRRSGIAKTFVQYLLNRSRREMTRMKITGPATDSCVVTTDVQLTKTGLVSSTISPMVVDVMFNGHRVAMMHLPEIKTSTRGAKFTIQQQKVRILDKTHFKAFLQSVIADEATSIRLENGQCTATTLNIKVCCNFCLDIPIKGMGGPKAKIAWVDRRGDDIMVLIMIENPGPVELEHGTTIFELRNEGEEIMAVLRGSLQIAQGTSDCILRGKLRAGAAPTSMIKLVGVCAESEDAGAWSHETAQYFDLLLAVKPEFMQVLG
ncbi:hypothetical protein RJ55_00158 [Drechmeria coniospora]|nr:hypothetical protein RJ55_00158 [Drechmeria coniospora]